jgi:hypothetical protein
MGWEQRTICEGRNVSLKHFLDNGISVQVQCLPPRCRADSLFPWVATGHQSQKRA